MKEREREREGFGLEENLVKDTLMRIMMVLMKLKVSFKRYIITINPFFPSLLFLSYFSSFLSLSPTLPQIQNEMKEEAHPSSLVCSYCTSCVTLEAKNSSVPLPSQLSLLSLSLSLLSFSLIFSLLSPFEMRQKRKKCTRRHMDGKERDTG